MKTIIANTINSQAIARVILVIAISFIGIRCEDKVIEWDDKASDMVVTDYIYNNEEIFSEFGKALQITGLENLLRVRGPFTLLAPTNDAMQKYYSRIGVSSIDQIDTQVLYDMVSNHIFSGSINTGSIGLGTLPFENILGDFVASDLPGSDILLNKQAIIIKRDIEVSNGFVHHIDNVIDPLTDHMYDVLKSDGGYQIFLAGLEACGLADTLKTISFPYGTSTARARFTILAVPDTLYQREGIATINDLIAKYSTSDDLTNVHNGLYQYIEYHCLSGSHYFSDFQPDDIYYLISNSNYINIKVEEDFKINKTTDGYTGFYFDQSNIPAKNGALHTVNTLMPYTETEPAVIVHQVTDYFDLQQQSFYLEHYQSFYDGQNTFEYIKWDAEYLLYYLKYEDNGLTDKDALKLGGHFWIEITTPKIRAGKYMLSSFSLGVNGATMNCFVDGELLGEYNSSDISWNGDPLDIGEIEFTETKNHIIRLKTTVPGQFFWDRIIFTPVE